MSATLAIPAAPPHALLCWLDDRYVYVSIPTINGQPFVEKFALCDAGLGKALNLLRLRYDELPSHQKNYTIPPLPKLVTKGKPPVQSDEQRTQALAVLRRMGIV